LDQQDPLYSLGYFAAFLLCLLIFFGLSKFMIAGLKMFQTSSNISLKTSVKNITQAKSITPITIMSLGLGVTLLLTLALVGTNFKREIAKSIPAIAPDYFFLGIQQEDKNIFQKTIISMDPSVKLEVVPIISSAITKINGIDPNTYIQPSNDSYWVISRERRSSWADVTPEDNPIVAGTWWDMKSVRPITNFTGRKSCKGLWYSSRGYLYFKYVRQRDHGNHY
jgi:putative ABC transport system permease protein